MCEEKDLNLQKGAGAEQVAREGSPCHVAMLCSFQLGKLYTLICQNCSSSQTRGQIWSLHSPQAHRGVSSVSYAPREIFTTHLPPPPHSLNCHIMLQKFSLRLQKAFVLRNWRKTVPAPCYNLGGGTELVRYPTGPKSQYLCI